MNLATDEMKVPNEVPVPKQARISANERAQQGVATTYGNVFSEPAVHKHESSEPSSRMGKSMV